MTKDVIDLKSEPRCFKALWIFINGTDKFLILKFSINKEISYFPGILPNAYLQITYDVSIEYVLEILHETQSIVRAAPTTSGAAGNWDGNWLWPSWIKGWYGSALLGGSVTALIGNKKERMDNKLVDRWTQGYSR
uniref:Uncharacterized protein n=1 Tax=Syphacia muris TaxID=451379 RepID=A0A0N5AJE2_9BILA